jgi:hypothetical protein
MKKILIVLVVFVLVAPTVTFAISSGSDSGSNQGLTGSDSGSNQGQTGSDSGSNSNSTAVSTLDNPLKVNSLGDLVKSGIQVFSYIAVLIAVLMFIVVGLRYILAQGKPQKMKEASQWLLYVVIGVAIVIGANVAITIVINTLSATGVVDPKVIQSAQNAIK